MDVNQSEKFPRPFLLERYFAEHEFTAPHMLCASDCESLPMAQLVSMMKPDTRELWDNLALGYTESQGHPKLRHAVAEMYEHDAITPEKVQILAPAEGIYVALRSLLKAGDRVVCTWPGYQSLSEVALAQGAHVDRWEVEEGDAGFYFDVDKLEQLLQSGPCRGVIVNFPHNPTGALPSHDQWERIIRLVSQHDAFLFSDEMYRGLEYDSGDCLASACTVYKQAISLSGMSKVYGMPGLRIGWLVSQNTDMLGSCAAYRDYCTICASAPAEVLSLAGLENSAKLLAQSKARVLKTIEAIEEMLSHPEASAHFTFHRPKAGPISLIGLRGKQCGKAYCKRLVEQSGVLLLPSHLLEWKEHYMRIGFGRDSGPAVVRRWYEAVKGGLVPE
ncbi:capreomycidine synthase-like [Sycon ciliatum]|uniref:capreomycidine synthase-like n=1 Tax=Sycon ciliatum TaxID=27933 RepID=UPI0031F61172